MIKWRVTLDFCFQDSISFARFDKFFKIWKYLMRICVICVLEFETCIIEIQMKSPKPPPSHFNFQTLDLFIIIFFLLILGSSSTRIIRFWSRNIFNDIRQLRNQINHLWSWQNYQSVQRRWNSNGRKPPYQLETGYSKTQEILIYLQVLQKNTCFFQKKMLNTRFEWLPIFFLRWFFFMIWNF